jgi:hypothetical protein
MRLLDRLRRRPTAVVDEPATALLELPRPGRHRAPEKPEDAVTPRVLADAQAHRLARTYRDTVIPPVVVGDRLGAVVAARLETETRPAGRARLVRPYVRGAQ